MVLGTSSHVGKSLITAALCRIFADAGYRVAPFKSQNMSLNSAATVEGLEIGRAQALQAEAAGVPASVHMNPILLKPCGDISSQVVVHGKVWGKVSAADYHLRRVEELMPMVRESYETLAAAHEVILIEGAGSPAEINLKEHDIVNMRIAAMADARCLLVGDIDRGGVFAALWGTVALLDPDEQARIDGFLINKFRGDVALLEPGIRMIEERLGKPCAGVVPWLDHLALEEEDGLGLDVAAQSVSWTETGDARPLRIAVIAYPTFSNFTDFDSLRMEPSVALRFCRSPEQLEQADVVILPGSKQTIDDLRWMRTQKLDRALQVHARTGLVAGICGGMQMLGQHIFDPLGMETEGSIRGLGLLPIETTMQPEKITRLAHGELLTATLFGQPIPQVAIRGYEIHLGQTRSLEHGRPFCKLARDRQGNRLLPHHADGSITLDGRIFGTYLHGLFDEDAFRHTFIAAGRAFHHLAPASTLESWRERREESLQRLADTVRKSVDLERIFEWVGYSYPETLQMQRPS
jgi:adenosylcobyric acid synthase